MPGSTRSKAAACAALLALAAPAFAAEGGRGASMLDALRDRDPAATWDATGDLLPPGPPLRPVVEPLFVPSSPSGGDWRPSRAAARAAVTPDFVPRLAQETADPFNPTPAPGPLGGNSSGRPNSGRIDPGRIGPEPIDPGVTDPRRINPDDLNPGGPNPGRRDPGGLDSPRLDPGGLNPGGLDLGGNDAGGNDPGGNDAGGLDPGGNAGGDARGLLGEDIAPGTDEDRPIARRPDQLRRIGEIMPYFDYEPDPDVDDPCLNLCPRPDGLPCKQYAEGEIMPPCPDEVGLGEEPFTPRSIPPSVFAWKASNVHYNPLYFEDVPLERYGHTYGDCVQPFVSLGKFGVQLVGLPYQMALDPPCKKVYPLGYYRPGEPAPKLCYQIPFNARAAAVTAGFYTGMAAILP